MPTIDYTGEDFGKQEFSSYQREAFKGITYGDS